MAIETFKIINKIAPVCLRDLLHTKNSKYTFRYSNTLEIPQVRITRYGKMSFKLAAATLCNSFPNHFRTVNSFSKIRSHTVLEWVGMMLLLVG